MKLNTHLPFQGHNIAKLTIFTLYDQSQLKRKYLSRSLGLDLPSRKQDVCLVLSDHFHIRKIIHVNIRFDLKIVL